MGQRLAPSLPGCCGDGTFGGGTATHSEGKKKALASPATLKKALA